MKFTFRIHQAGVAQQGLIGKVDVNALCLLDYLGGWFFCAKATRVTVGHREYRWLDYAHAVVELPLLFNPEACIRTGKNALSRMMRRLREAGLVETVSVGRRLFFRLTDRAAALASHREATATKSRPTVTGQRDETLTPTHDETVTPNRDDAGASNIDETDNQEANIKEPKHSLAQESEECGASASPSLSSLSLEAQAAGIYAAYPRLTASCATAANLLNVLVAELTAT